MQEKEILVEALMAAFASAKLEEMGWPWKKQVPTYGLKDAFRQPAESIVCMCDYSTVMIILRALREIGR